MTAEQLFDWDGAKPPREPKGQVAEPMVKLRPPWVMIRRTDARPLAHRWRGLMGRDGAVIGDCGVAGAKLEVDGEPMALACPTCLRASEPHQ